jgi:hypothetical protein
MGRSLRVLVLESERGAADVAIGELTGAGHAVVRCHEPGEAAFPCKALRSNDCPLERGDVDVAITVRSRPRSQPAPHEDGVRCALQRHVPLVVAGSPVLNPFEPWATTVIDRTFDVVGACEVAAAAPLPAHGTRALEAIEGVLAQHDVAGVHPSVEVHRHGGGLEVSVHGAKGLDHTVKAMASVRMIGALRELDSTATGIDVSFVE